MSTMIEFYERLEKESWSGEVEVTSSQGNATVLIHRGKLIYAHRPIQRSIERFEKIAWLNLPPPELLQHIKTWEELVSRITKVNQDRYQRLSRFLKTERLELFFRTFFWENIELFPRPFEVPPIDNLNFPFYTPRNLSKLIKEANHRIQEWPLIQKKVGSSKRVFVSQVSLPSEDTNKDTAETDAVDEALLDFEDALPDTGETHRLPFAPEQIELIKLCDGNNSLEDIIRLSQDGEYLTLRRIIELWENDIIYPRDLQDQRQSKNKEGLFLWAEIPKVVFISGLLGLIFGALFLVREPQPARLNISTSVVQSIEIYRHQEGRYPITLLELREAGTITQSAYEQHEYTLLNPYEYSLRVKP